MVLMPEEVVADLGCGTGYVTIPMAARVTNVYAIDAQKAMLEALAEDLPHELKDKVVPIQSELPRIPLEDRSIDRAVAVNVVHEGGTSPPWSPSCGAVSVRERRFTIVDFPKGDQSRSPSPAG